MTIRTVILAILLIIQLCSQFYFLNRGRRDIVNYIGVGAIVFWIFIIISGY